MKTFLGFCIILLSGCLFDEKQKKDVPTTDVLNDSTIHQTFLFDSSFAPLIAAIRYSQDSQLTLSGTLNQAGSFSKMEWVIQENADSKRVSATFDAMGRIDEISEINSGRVKINYETSNELKVIAFDDYGVKVLDTVIQNELSPLKKIGQKTSSMAYFSSNNSAQGTSEVKIECGGKPFLEATVTGMLYPSNSVDGFASGIPLTMVSNKESPGNYSFEIPISPLFQEHSQESEKEIAEIEERMKTFCIENDPLRAKKGFIRILKDALRVRGGKLSVPVFAFEQGWKISCATLSVAKNYGEVYQKWIKDLSAATFEGDLVIEARYGDMKKDYSVHLQGSSGALNNIVLDFPADYCSEIGFSKQDWIVSGVPGRASIELKRGTSASVLTTISYTIYPKTATPNIHFGQGGGQVQILPGSNTALIPVQVFRNTSDVNVTVGLELTGAWNGKIGVNSTADLTIRSSGKIGYCDDGKTINFKAEINNDGVFDGLYEYYNCVSKLLESTSYYKNGVLDGPINFFAVDTRAFAGILGTDALIDYAKLGRNEFRFNAINGIIEGNGGYIGETGWVIEKGKILRLQGVDNLNTWCGIGGSEDYRGTVKFENGVFNAYLESSFCGSGKLKAVDKYENNYWIQNSKQYCDDGSIQSHLYYDFQKNTKEVTTSICQKANP